MTTYLQMHGVESPNPLFNWLSFRLWSYTFSSSFNDGIVEDRAGGERSTEGRCSSVERDPGGIRYFGAPCHSFSLKVLYVFEQTVTRINALIICAYFEYMRKDMSPFNFDSDRICSLGGHIFVSLAKRILAVYWRERRERSEDERTFSLWSLVMGSV